MIQGPSQTKNVCSCICLPISPKLFRRRISNRSKADCILHMFFLIFPRSSKINQHHSSIWPQHNICRLHISINNRWFSGMQIFQYITELFCPCNYHFLRLCPLLLQCQAERSSFDVVHHDQKYIFVFQNICNLRKIGMIQSFENIRLCQKFLPHRPIISIPFLLNFLDRPLSICSLIHCKVNCAHPSPADFI